MTEQDQVDALYAAQATSDLEHELIEALPARIDPFRDATSHTVDLYEIVLETGRMAFFKPLNAYQNATTPLKRALVNYGHTPVSTLVSECGSRTLDDFELAAVSSLIADDLGNLRGYLAEDRASALLARAQRLQQGREVLPPGEL